MDTQFRQARHLSLVLPTLYALLAPKLIPSQGIIMFMNISTPTEAAALTGLSLKAIQKAIDEKAIPCRVVRQHGKPKRYLENASLICLLTRKAARFLIRVSTGSVAKNSKYIILPLPYCTVTSFSPNFENRRSYSLFPLVVPAY